MKALVTGGTGFVGSHLIEALRAGGDSVRALVRPGGDRELVVRLGAEPAAGSLDDAESLRAACRGCDVVYHAAARVEVVGSYREFFDATVLGTGRLLRAAREAGVRRFVYVSSCGIYHPRLMAAGVITERTPTPPPPRWFSYGRTKLAAEDLVRRESPPMDWVVVRLGYIYGPRNRALHRYFRPFCTNGPLMIIGDGRNEMTMLYVEDAARALASAGRTPAAAGQTLIAAGNERVTQRDYLNAIADGFGAPRPTKHIPYPLAYFFGWMGEWIIRYIPSQAKIPLTRSVVALTGLPQRIDDSYSQGVLNWRPQVRFADGIRRAFEWYAAEYGTEAAASPVPSRS